MNDAVDRVQREVLRAFDCGMLGVVAAHFDVAEKKLRDFASGDYNALAVETVARMYQEIAMRGRL